jgi:hypothetical protein
MLYAQPLMVDSPALAFQNPNGQPDKPPTRTHMPQDRSSRLFKPAQIAAASKTGRQATRK